MNHFTRNSIVFLGFLLLILNFTLHSQVKHIGIPEIKYYDRQTYSGGTQNWSIVQDERGLMYFGNNQGLISFDGSHWDMFPLDNHSISRSTARGEQGRIYTGGYNELGYLQINDSGKRVYVNITDKVPKAHQNFGEIWRIHVTGHGVIYQSYSTVLLYHDNKIKVLADNEDFQFSFYHDGVFYISHRTKGLLRYTGQEFLPVLGGDFFTEDRKLWAMLPHEGSAYLMGTQDKGIFLFEDGRVSAWETPANEFLKKNQLFSAAKLSEEYYAFGSIQDGLIICDLDGTIIQHINKDRGLANNTVLSLQVDKWDNLWCGLDNGINYIEIHSPITYLDEGRNIEGTGYTSAIYNDKFYLGTNQGVYFDDWRQGGYDIRTGRNFRLIKELKGQAWKLKTLDERLFCGHNKGTFVINNGNVRQISEVEGGWDYLRVPGNDTLIIGGTYSGLIRFVKKNDKWEYRGRVKGFDESCRDIFFDKHGDIWMNHGYLGIYRFNFNKTFDKITNVTKIGPEHGLHTPTEFYLFNHKKEVFHSNYDSVFQFNYLTDRFEYNKEWTERFGGKGVNRINIDKYRNIWYFGRYRNHVEVLLNPESPWSKKNFEILNKLDEHFINAFEHVHVIDRRNILFGIEKGFAHLDPLLEDEEQKDFQVLINSFKAYSKNDTVVKHCYHNAPDKEISYILYPKTTSIKFNYSAAFYEGTENMQYNLKLKGPDGESYTNWTSSNTKEFTNLDYGNYTLTLKAKNVYGKESEPVSISFMIETPWHQTIWAYIGYIVLGISAVLLASWFIEQRIENERKKVEEKRKEEVHAKEEQRQQDAIVFENKIIQLRNDKLKAEVDRKISDVELKNKELASFAMQINHKNEILNHMKKELDKVRERVNDQAKSQISELTKKVDEDLQLDKDWEQFKLHFDRVQQGFIKKMQENYPNLKPNDLKLCAFLRMNLSTKEIAPLMNISIRGVEIHRYRLRKKLGLKRETDLVKFLMQL